MVPSNFFFFFTHFWIACLCLSESTSLRDCYVRNGNKLKFILHLIQILYKSEMSERISSLPGNDNEKELTPTPRRYCVQVYKRSHKKLFLPFKRFRST